MSKKKATKVSETSDSVETAECAQQPSVFDVLLKNGTAVLEAPTIEALNDLVDQIPADCRYSVGAVGRKGDGSAYTLRVMINN
jgi:hypothetical protein